MMYFSIIIPTYNRAYQIDRALRSVWAQGKTKCEVIVVDDGSSDDTRKLLDPLIKSKRIRYVREENKGVSAARNLGVRSAKGEVIVFLDSDDELSPRYTELAHKVFQDQAAEVMVPGFILQDEKGKASYASPQKQIWLLGMGGGVALRRNVFIEKNIWFDEKLKNFEDSDFGFRVASHCRVRFVDKPLYVYHFKSAVYKNQETNLSSDPKHRLLDFEYFKQKNLPFYKKHGAPALGYLYFWEGTLRASDELKQARSLFLRSFFVQPNLRTGAYVGMSILGSRRVYVLLHRLLIVLRRRYKMVKHKL